MTMIDKWLSDAFESLDSIEGKLPCVCVCVCVRVNCCQF